MKMSTLLRSVFSAVFILISIQSVRADRGFVFESKEPHRVRILHDGPIAFVTRLDMIKRARRSIDFEYFMFNLDDAGRTMARALMARAQEGIRVRMLIDKSPYLGLTEYEMKEFEKAGIKVKIYNPRSIIELQAYQFRNHKKVLIVDGKEALVGGRNMGDEYYFNYENYNFNDRDIWVEGPIARKVETVFTYFWNHEMANDLKAPKPPSKNLLRLGRNQREKYINLLRIYRKYTKKAKDFLNDSAKDLKTRLEFRKSATAQDEKNPFFTCDDIEYLSDGPGWRKEARFMADYIYGKLRQSKRRITLESPYFVTQDEERLLFNQLLEQGVEVSLLTNSIRSSDNILIVNHFNHRVKYFTERGMNIYIHKGNHINPEIDIPRKQALQMPWGTHAKTFVFDDEDTFIGSYNMDPRSHNYSAENGFICHDNVAIALNVRRNIEERQRLGAVLLDEEARPVDGQDILLDAPFHHRLGHHLVTFFASLFDFWL